ncbi:MAG: hypothetical protein HC910_22960 [Spirulinaceae cyanobacterium SM2_1_0]|nr:hypothetical protein [Spirulinaceae cyanobacterium SM2_1_0]
MCEQTIRESLCGAGQCELLATPGDSGLGVLNIDELGIMRCWHPVVRTAAGWVVFEAAALGQHGSEVDQNVDRLTSRIENNDAGEFLLIEYADHIYERNWDYADFEDEDAEPPPWETIDAESVVVCRRDGVPACTQPITVRYEYRGDDGTTGDYSAQLSLRGGTIVIAAVTSSGKVELGVDRRDWEGILMLPAGEYEFGQLATPRP